MYAAKYGAADLRRTFKTPEGAYKLKSEKRYGRMLYTIERQTTRITLALLKGGEEEGWYVIMNVGEALHICLFDACEREAVRMVRFRRDTWPVCHCFAPAEDDADLLVGLSNGEVVLLSLRQQIQFDQSQASPLATYTGSHRPEDEVVCTAVTWAASEDPTQFVATFSDGTLRIFDKGKSISGADIKFNSGTRGVAPNDTIDLCCGCIHDASVSPDGTKLAVVSKDGLLRVFDSNSRQLLTGFQSYYGGLLCCAWSPDSKYVATGGEDDMVSIFSVKQGCVIAFGEGHDSWISQVAFDIGQENTVENAGTTSTFDDEGLRTSFYRVGSIGQDAKVALWDIEVDDDLDAAEVLTPGGRSLSSGAAPLEMVADESIGGPFARHSLDSQQENGSDGAGVICPAIPHRDMDIKPPITIHKIHRDPGADIVFTEDFMFTCDCTGHLRCWWKPGANAAQPTKSPSSNTSLAPDE
ncbi:hypothetical protein BSKO_03426 [Bryopsis sp. KO-2023]|nr:hypothetical protein BSKO_03426 [Bryopsis sp. KO-2023]